MTFQSNIPLPTDLISTSQSDILNNFQAIGTTYPTDHVNFNASGAGFHQRVTLLKPIADPNQTAPATTIYTKAAPVTAISDLYYQVGAGPTAVSQFTGGGITSTAWCQFVGTTPGTNPPSQGYNVSSVTRNGTGDYTVTFIRLFNRLDYAVNITPSLNQGGPNKGGTVFITNRSFGSLRFTVQLQGVANDSVDINVLIFGQLQ